MTVFDVQEEEIYVGAMLQFLGLAKEEGIVMLDSLVDDEVQRRRFIQALEVRVNAKIDAATSDSMPSTGRLRLACAYLGLDSAGLLEEVGMSESELDGCSADRLREVAPWLEGRIHAPIDWIAGGKLDLLPADHHIGAYVGKLSLQSCEALFGITQSWFADTELEWTESESVLAPALEKAVFTVPLMAYWARRAGGRWAVPEGQMEFIKWRPGRLFAAEAGPECVEPSNYPTWAELWTRPRATRADSYPSEDSGSTPGR